MARVHPKTFSYLKKVEDCRGGSRIVFRRGCTGLLLYFNTNKPHSFFFSQNTRCIRKPQVISVGGEGGAHPLHLPPRFAPGLDGLLLGQDRSSQVPVIVLVGIRTTTLKDDLNFEFENSDILHETENKRRRTTTATTLTFEF